MKTSEDISIIVQGPVIREPSPRSMFSERQGVTKKCLLSLRENFPDSELILSTWVGCDTKGLTFDKIVFSPDPGSSCRDDRRGKLDTTNRQIVSTASGIRKSTRKYALKVRSDLCFLDRRLIKIHDYYRSLERTSHYTFSKERILVSNVTTFDARLKKAPFHVSDWIYYGLTEDLLEIFEIPLMPDPDFTRWYVDKDRPFYDVNPSNLSRYHAECWIFKSWLEKHVDLKFSHTTDVSNDNIEKSVLSVANNTIIASPSQLGFRSLLHDWGFSKVSQNVTHSKWIEMVAEKTGKPVAIYPELKISVLWEILHCRIIKVIGSSADVKFDESLGAKTFFKLIIAMPVFLPQRILRFIIRFLLRTRF